jgi:hypothetical protein
LLGGRVSLDPSKDLSGPEAGSTDLKPPADLRSLRRDLSGYIRTAAAGREAQLKAIRVRLVPLDSQRTRNRAMLNAVMTDLHDRNLVAQYLAAVGARSDKRTVRRRYERAAAEVGILLRKHNVWQAVRAVADVLLKENEITGEDVRRLVGPVPAKKVTKRHR